MPKSTRKKSKRKGGVNVSPALYNVMTSGGGKKRKHVRSTRKKSKRKGGLSVNPEMYDYLTGGRRKKRKHMRSTRKKSKRNGGLSVNPDVLDDLIGGRRKKRKHVRTRRKKRQRGGNLEFGNELEANAAAAQQDNLSEIPASEHGRSERFGTSILGNNIDKTDSHEGPKEFLNFDQDDSPIILKPVGAIAMAETLSDSVGVRSLQKQNAQEMAHSEEPDQDENSGWRGRDLSQSKESALPDDLKTKINFYKHISTHMQRRGQSEGANTYPGAHKGPLDLRQILSNVGFQDSEIREYLETPEGENLATAVRNNIEEGKLNPFYRTGIKDHRHIDSSQVDPSQIPRVIDQLQKYENNSLEISNNLQQNLRQIGTSDVDLRRRRENWEIATNDYLSNLGRPRRDTYSKSHFSPATGFNLVTNF